MKVDIHSHVLPPETMGKAGKYGPEMIADPSGGLIMRVGDYRSRPQRSGTMAIDKRLTDPAPRIEHMDKNGIDKMGVTISPLFYLYEAEPEIGTPFARVQNDALSKFCRAFPDRFFFMATLPLQDIGGSLKEIDRVLQDPAAKGINIGTDHIAGHELDDEVFWPVYEKIEQCDVPIFVHPYPSPIQAGGDDRFNLSWVAGYVHQEMLAFCHLVFGGVLDAFPKLKICISHGGGPVPFQWGRLEYAMSRMPDVKAKKPLREYLANFYFDVLVHDLAARRYLLEFMGADNLVVGDNYPGWDSVDGFKLIEEMHLPEAQSRKILGDNAARIFKL